MRPLLVSAALAAVLAVSLAGKTGSLGRSAPAPADADDTVSVFLQGRGFAVKEIASADTLAWTVAVKDSCAVRVAEVSPQGWSRDVVAAQAEGDRVLYAFGGTFYADQPVLRTTLGEYRRRLERYLRLPEKPLVVRAVLLSPGCPQSMLGAEDASVLSR